MCVEFSESLAVVLLTTMGCNTGLTKTRTPGIKIVPEGHSGYIVGTARLSLPCR